MIYELRELIDVDTPLGRGKAFLIESGTHDYWWTVVFHNGAIVTFTQNKIRMLRSYSHDRGISDEEMKEIIK